ncbi:MAG: hypothetical protein VX079_10660, partial [Pseudomonadota bacterium]|nr:hypothetical protein [Pseudomonadota bacterium]
DRRYCQYDCRVRVGRDAHGVEIRGGGMSETRRVARRVAQFLGSPVLDNGLIGEAGGVDSDRLGTLIVH